MVNPLSTERGSSPALKQSAEDKDVLPDESSLRPPSLVALEAQFSKEQIEALRRVAVLLAACALKVARERGILK